MPIPVMLSGNISDMFASLAVRRIRARVRRTILGIQGNSTSLCNCAAESKASIPKTKLIRVRRFRHDSRVRSRPNRNAIGL